jgi:hypothetical protein
LSDQAFTAKGIVVRRSWALVLLAQGFANSANANSCDIPIDGDQFQGRQDNGLYAFEYSSYFWENKIGLYEFGRCVYNEQDSPLWIDWSGLGLNGTAKPQREISNKFTVTSESKNIGTTSLFFGAGPLEITPEAVFQPDEVVWDQIANGRVWRAQMDQRPDLLVALQSEVDFQQQFKLLQESGLGDRFVVESSATIALPVDKEAFGRLKEESGYDELNDKFYTFRTSIGYEFKLIDDLPIMREFFSAMVDERDKEIFSIAEPIFVDVLGESVVDGFLIDEENLETIKVRYDDGQFDKIRFPMELRNRTVKMTFGEYGSVLLPTVGLIDSGS